MSTSGRPVVTTPETASAIDAAKQMRDAGVGCVVLVDAEERPVGIVTDRDLAVRVVGTTADAQTTQLRDVMSSPLVTIAPDAPVDEVVEVMQRHGIRRLPLVTEPGELVGILALDDVLQGTAREMNDLGKETQAMMRWAKRYGALTKLQDDVDEKLHDAQMRARYANWMARSAFLHQIDAIGERLRNAIHKL